MRNMSFMLTTDQMYQRTKFVTRRLGWRFLKVGDIVMACEKCQGLKWGQKIVRICPIEIVEFVTEPLSLMLDEPYGSEESVLEGFPLMNGKSFVKMFSEGMK